MRISIRTLRLHEKFGCVLSCGLGKCYVCGSDSVRIGNAIFEALKDIK